MIPSKRDIIFRAALYHRRGLLSLALTTALVTATITASVLAGYSVRRTLSDNALERLNGGAVMVSSGIRYSPSQLATDLEQRVGAEAVPMLSLNGYAGNFQTGKRVMDVNIWGSERLSDMPERGEAVINSRLAEALEIEENDFVIVRFAPPSDLPSNTPFSPAKSEEGSLFLRVKRVTEGESYSNFNPSVSQIIPYNIFVNLNEFSEYFPQGVKVNRIMVSDGEAVDAAAVSRAVSEISLPEGIGLRIRSVPAAGGHEVISDRIFIDRFVADEIIASVDGASPVLTWLANSVTSASGITPYSFIAAVSGSSEKYFSGRRDIAVNRWMADDLSVGVGDTVTMAYYVTGRGNELVERSERFRVSAVVEMEGRWRDSLLMPEFPGIAGATSCTDWDAGIPLDLGSIRDKDEEYWYDFGGTPKGFISYATGVELWGNQFGPVTAIRFDGYASAGELREAIAAVESIGGFGLMVTDIRAEGVKAAMGGVDFSMLFLALTMFIIVSSLVMLVMITTNHLLQRQGEVRLLSALGFGRGRIVSLFAGEALLPITAGVMAGAAVGILFNNLIITALNTVWRDAVQTGTLVAHTGALQMAVAMVAAALIAIVTVVLVVRRFLSGRSLGVRPGMTAPSGVPRWIIAVAGFLLIALFILPLVTAVDVVIMQFAGGAVLMLFLLLLLREALMKGVAGRYYAFFPGKGVTPVLFIAAGLFVVVATGVNRKDFSGEAARRSSGTGGFTHWIETTIPVEENLNSSVVQRRRGIDPEGEEMLFLSLLRVDGDDASCLNLNHVTSPHILGIDAGLLAERGSFSFATQMKGTRDADMWELLGEPAGENAVYGVLDQTVMQWGMMLKAGDTVTVAAESGEPLHIIVAGGLQTSVFQGNLLIDASHFARWFPSVAGSTILLADAGGRDADDVTAMLSSSLESFGPVIQTTPSRLESFNRVNNTYLSVFLLLGGIGMILGVVGQGLNVRRDIEQRRSEYAVMAAAGFTLRKIRLQVLREQLVILAAGIITGLISAAVASATTLAGGGELPLQTVGVLVLLMTLAGVMAAVASLRSISREELTATLRAQ